MSSLPGNRFPIGWRRPAGRGRGALWRSARREGRWHVGRRDGARGRGCCPAGLGSRPPGIRIHPGPASRSPAGWRTVCDTDPCRPPASAPDCGRHSATASFRAGKDHRPAPGLPLAKGPSCRTAGGDLLLQGFVANKTHVPVAALQPFGYQVVQTGMTKFPSPFPQGLYCLALNHRLVQKKKENKSAHICGPTYIQN